MMSVKMSHYGITPLLTELHGGTSPSAAGVILQLDVYMEQIAIQVPIKNKVLAQKLLPFIFRHRAPSFLT